MRILFALSGLHKVNRGAEVAFISVARELARIGHKVTLVGSGMSRDGEPYRFLPSGSLSRRHFESFPSLPALRDDCSYEDLTFALGLLFQYRPGDYDITVTCSYPWSNWLLRLKRLRGRRPRHVFVTQNGDWPAYAQSQEYRFFGCDGLVCINPDFYERNLPRWRSALIPNGVDMALFFPGPPDRAEFKLPADEPVILMVSALIDGKRVSLGIDAVSQIPNAHLVVAGDGPLRDHIRNQASALLPGRFTQLSIPIERMPLLYRSADVFMHLSKDESFGNVFIEAMATGLPVVAPESKRTRWIVGDNEFLVDFDDPSEIAGKIGLALADTSGGESRVARAKAFSWTAIAQQYETFFNSILAT